MKKNLLTILCFAFTAKLFAQELSSTDLIKYFLMEVPAITADISKKNFKLIKKSNDDIIGKSNFTYFWAVDFDNNKNDAFEWFTVSTFNDAKSRIMYETKSKNNFLAFKQGLKKQNFKFTQNFKNPDEEELSSIFENDKYVLTIQPRFDRWTIYLRKK